MGVPRCPELGPREGDSALAPSGLGRILEGGATLGTPLSRHRIQLGGMKA